MFAKIGLTLSLLVIVASVSAAHEFKIGNLTIGHPWSRATPNGAKVGGGYFTITNNGATPDRLVSVSAPGVADHVEIHEMGMNNNVMTMRQVAGGVTVDPGKTVAFVPGGFHLMMMGLKSPLKEGDRVKADLNFEKAGKVEVTINVESMGAQHPAAGEDHSMHKM